MQIIKDEITKLNNTIVTLGKFEGNHIGHRALFNEAKKIKEKSEKPLETVIFTFDVNPKNVVSGKKPETIYTNAERMSIEEQQGLDFCFVWPFTKENMSMEPEEFVKKLLSERLGARHIVVGEDFRFGKNRRGDVSLLRSLQAEFGFQLHALEKIKYKGEEVSSTAIKRCLQAGNLKDANYMLGSPFSVSGKVTGGKHLGKSLGFPTINFAAEKEKVLPPNGVYATKTIIDNTSYQSMTNIGIRPTFEENAAKNIETNIFDFDRDIYGKTVKVEFYEYIRPEKHFESAAELVAEIERNRTQIKEYFDSYVN